MGSYPGHSICFLNSCLDPCMGPSGVGLSLEPLVRHSVDVDCSHLSMLRDMQSHHSPLPDPFQVVPPEVLSGVAILDSCGAIGHGVDKIAFLSVVLGAPGAQGQ